MYVIGKTGMGKTNLLENLLFNDIMAGHGVGIVDPHGDFAERILDFIPSHRINDVVYMNPSDVNYPLAFNILETVDETHKHLIASGLMGVFKKIWPDVWSARMEYILNNTVLALLDYPGSTLLGINRMLADTNFRKRVIAKINDPVVKSFWVNEFAKYNDRYASEAIAPIQNKVGQFLSTAVIRNIVGQVRSTINVRDIMDSGKIFVMNLAKGRIGEDNSRLLGGMLITKIQLAAMERVDTPEDDRRDFYLYVDEFQNFATESFSNILSEARKYRLSLIVAHQYIEQLDEKVAAAVFGNVGTIISFRVGGADALKLVPEFTPRFTEEDLVNLAKYSVYLKLMIDGVSSDPFSATILPPLSQRQNNNAKVIAVSRERYGTSREVVEDKINRWSEGIATTTGSAASSAPVVVRRMDAAPAAQPVKTIVPAPAAIPGSGAGSGELQTKKRKKKKPPENAKPPVDNPAVYKCSRCGTDTMLNFIPDPSKPIYCKECLKEVRSGRAAPVVVVAEKPPALSAKSAETPAPMSLDAAMQMKPVDFRGRVQQPRTSGGPSAIPSPADAPATSPIVGASDRGAPEPKPVPVKPTVLKPGQSMRLRQ
ncbi:type IV secretion system DNA-binding domain-containing protein [Candidatus Uhrbacteria bacterium]|nr:type IV secretion system DNA-binding domain-containing protein [Candidatus Uhrbacteria bacterium]